MPPIQCTIVQPIRKTKIPCPVAAAVMSLYGADVTSGAESREQCVTSLKHKTCGRHRLEHVLRPAATAALQTVAEVRKLEHMLTQAEAAVQVWASEAECDRLAQHLRLSLPRFLARHTKSYRHRAGWHMLRSQPGTDRVRTDEPVETSACSKPTLPDSCCCTKTSAFWSLPAGAFALPVAATGPPASFPQAPQKTLGRRTVSASLPGCSTANVLRQRIERHPAAHAVAMAVLRLWAS